MSRGQEEKSGIRLFRLLEEHGREILAREADNRTSVHLYCTGTYWVAFEKSAYQLKRFFPQGETSIFQFAFSPVPVVMTSVKAQELQALLHRQGTQNEETDYQMLDAQPFPAAYYWRWHANEVKTLQ